MVEQNVFFKKKNMVWEGFMWTPWPLPPRSAHEPYAIWLCGSNIWNVTYVRDPTLRTHVVSLVVSLECVYHNQ